MEVQKEVIRPGVYTYLHPKTGLPAKLIVTPDTIKHFATQGAAMLKAGLSIPVPVEHQPDAKPLTESEMAANQLLNNAGWVKGFNVGEVKEKDEGGKDRVVKDVLFSKVDILDPAIYDKLPSTIKFTSPWINSFTDGAGKRWDGVISHLALTTRPRITQQQPFATDMAAALSLVGKLSDQSFNPKGIRDGFAISEAGLMKKVGSEFKPQYPIAFSLLSGIKLSKEEIEEAIGDDDADVIEEDEEVPEVPEVEEGRTSPLEDVGVKDVTIHETIGHLLKALGFRPPDGMSAETFERDLYETLMAKVQELGAKGIEADETPPPVEDDDRMNTNNNPVIQESPAMYASMNEVNAIQDPKERKLAGMLFSLQQKASAAEKHILQSAKKERDQKIERIAKRLPVKRRDALLAMCAAPSAQLSLGDDGSTVKDPMATMLDILDGEMPDLLKRSDQKERPQPDDGNMLSDERREQIVAEVMRNTGGVYAAAK